MRKLLPVFIFLVVIFGSFAQDKTGLNVLESLEFHDKVKSSEVITMHKSGSGLLGVVRNSSRNLMFDVFNESLDRVQNKLVAIERKEEYCGQLAYGSFMKVFTVFAPSKKERILFCYEFNIENGTHTKTELFKADVERNQKLFSGANKRQTGFAISNDGAYFVISTDNVKKHSNSYTVRVYNSADLAIVYTKAYQENTKKFYEPNDIFIDNAANVFSLGKLYQEGRAQKKEGKSNYDFVLNKVTQDVVASTVVEINQDEHIKSLVFSNSESKLRLLGFYSEKKVNNIKGVLRYDVDTEMLKVSKSKSVFLPEDVYKDLYSKDASEKKKDKELSSYYIDYVLNDKQGNTYLLAEEFFVTNVYVATGMNGGGYWQTVYHYDDILVLKFNTEGTLEWGRSIFKRSGAPSYNAFVKKGELHVILNSGKNLKEKEDGRVKVSKGLFESSALYDITYNEAGDVKYNKIQDNKKNKYYLPFYGIFNAERFITISGGLEKKFLILE
ncbi:hypothetical protein [Snuella sedimenti]|uniref:Uncharacterized protein n=1 Tax=Snuella sedimenti TaxID=2798802 RepID=A0A8J7LTF6_9FLAO|nr:hypothetical protein [Snuella sedimenti]MBJ6369180.1 hypothetical protein [Snuella sedimenti]